MAKETIDAVKSAEEQAAGIKDEAAQKAENIISDAKAQAADILKAAKTGAESDNIQRIKKAELNADEIIKLARAQADRLSLELRDSAVANKEKAIVEILKKIIA